MPDEVYTSGMSIVRLQIALQFDYGLESWEQLLRRKIIDFHQDQESHWVADLDCGHTQHTRHDPPLFPRPWVITTAGRDSRIGTELECGWCDRKTIPDSYAPYKQTSVFNAKTIPPGLRQQHSTKAGVWGIIHIVRGTLLYRIHHPFHSEETLDPHTQGIVLPEVTHEVQPSEDAEFYVEFWRRDEPSRHN